MQMLTFSLSTFFTVLSLSAAAVKVHSVKNERVYGHLSVTEKVKADNLVTALSKKSMLMMHLNSVSHLRGEKNFTQCRIASIILNKSGQ